MRFPCPIAEHASRTPEAEALRFEGRSWTYAELDADVGAWTAQLEARGVREDTRVVLVANNHPDVVRLFFALARLRATLFSLNARLTAPELRRLVERVQPEHTFVQRELLAALPEGGVLDELAEGAARARVDASGPARSAARVVLFTSGTTGQPKGALLSEEQFRASATASAANLGAFDAPRWLATLPLFHVGGLSMLTRTAYGGGCLVLQRRFEAQDALRAIEQEGVTHVSAVATTLERLLDALGPRPFPPTLHCALIGGGPVPAPLLARARSAGVAALQTYGLTECCSQVATERPEDADGSTSGPPLPGVELRIVTAEGEETRAGEEGEIEVRGPTLMQGYWDDPEATEASFRGGWFRTRDLGVVDGRGRLRVLSRRTDLIVRGGENVYPAEIEAVLAAHPCIREAAVISREDAQWGQVPIAFVVTRAPLDTATLEAWCRVRLARFKVPASFHETEALPRNAMGKVERSELRRYALP